MNWRVGDGITGHGRVVRRDVSRCGLHRLTVELAERYPDLDVWCRMLGQEARPLLHDYGERWNGRVLVCGLTVWFKTDLTADSFTDSRMRAD